MHKSSSSAAAAATKKAMSEHQHNIASAGATNLPFSIDQILSSSSSQMKQASAVQQAMSVASSLDHQRQQQQAAAMMMFNQAAGAQRPPQPPPPPLQAGGGLPTGALNEQLALLMAAQHHHNQQQQQQLHLRQNHHHHSLNPNAALAAAALAQQQLQQQLMAAAAAALSQQRSATSASSGASSDPSSSGGALSSLNSLVSQQNNSNNNNNTMNSPTAPSSNHLFSCFMASMLIHQQQQQQQQAQQKQHQTHLVSSLDQIQQQRRQHHSIQHLQQQQQPRVAGRRNKSSTQPGNFTSLMSPLEQQAKLAVSNQQQHAYLLTSHLNSAAAAAATNGQQQQQHQHQQRQRESPNSGNFHATKSPASKQFSNGQLELSANTTLNAHFEPGQHHQLNHNHSHYEDHHNSHRRRARSSSISPGPQQQQQNRGLHSLQTARKERRLSVREQLDAQLSPGGGGGGQINLSPSPPLTTATNQNGNGGSSSNLKPAHSYIGLIAMCILSTPEKRMVLNDIYQFILDHYPYYRNRGSGWRNSVRHNLSLNECFQKDIRAPNGKGHYWRIHPANMVDFMNGDFRRRRAQRQVRRHNNMEVPSDESDDESMEDATRPPLPEHFKRSLAMHKQLEMIYASAVTVAPPPLPPQLPTSGILTNCQGGGGAAPVGLAPAALNILGPCDQVRGGNDGPLTSSADLMSAAFGAAFCASSAGHGSETSVNHMRLSPDCELLSRANRQPSPSPPREHSTLDNFNEQQRQHHHHHHAI